MLLSQFARQAKSISTLWQSVCDAITWIRQQASKGFDPPKEKGREREAWREGRQTEGVRRSRRGSVYGAVAVKSVHTSWGGLKVHKVEFIVG